MRKKSGVYSRVLLFITLILMIYTASAQHSVVRLPFPINTQNYDEICPVFNLDESLLFFTKVGHPDFNKTLIIDGEDISEWYAAEMYEDKLRTIYSQISGRNDEDPVSSEYNQDVWYASFEGSRIKIYHAGYPLNDALPNSICSIYGEDEGFVVINQFSITGGMKEGFSIIQMNENHQFSFPKPIEIIDFSRQSSEINLTLSHDKQVMILSMENRDTGNKDLYVSLKMMDSLYSRPEPLAGVNTEFDETTPFISRDKEKLFFASNRPGGQGGLDIYVSEKLDYSYKKWKEPTTFNAFLNTPANESHPFVNKDETTIYFNSDREGSSDIFTAQLIRSKMTVPITIKVSVVMQETQENCPAEILWKKTFSEEDSWPGYWRSRDGYYELTLTENEPMSIKAVNRNYLSAVEIIDPEELMAKGISEYFVELVLTKDGIIVPKEKRVEEEISPELGLELEEGKKIVLNNIYFKRAKPDVVPESFKALRILAKVLKDRPSLIIRVEGHTDNVGDLDALTELSYERASAIQSFLISEGVPKYQVEIMGFGPTQPVTDNRTEAHRRKNRRVEIRVLAQ